MTVVAIFDISAPNLPRSEAATSNSGFCLDASIRNLLLVCPPCAALLFRFDCLADMVNHTSQFIPSERLTKVVSHCSGCELDEFALDDTLKNTNQFDVSGRPAV